MDKVVEVGVMFMVDCIKVEFGILMWLVWVLLFFISDGMNEKVILISVILYIDCIYMMCVIVRVSCLFFVFECRW